MTAPRTGPATPSRDAGRILRFGIVGGLGFATDAAGLVLLIAAGLHPVAARIGSIVVALYVTWRLNRRMTFRSSAPPTVREFAQYVAVGALSSLVNFGVYALLLTSGAVAWPLVATAIGSAVAMTVTFLGLDRWVFRSSGVR